MDLELSIESPILYSEPMSLHTSWKIGGPAEVFIAVAHKEDLGKILAYAYHNRIPLFPCGRGTNILVPDKGIKGITVALASHFSAFTIQGSGIKVQGGASLTQLARAAAAAGLSGLEFAAGIPGTIAGAVFMNAGAHGSSMADVFQRACAFSVEGKEITLEAADVSFGYRRSSIMEEPLVLAEIELLLVPGDKQKIKEKTQRNISGRKETQPQGPSAGSVFKNPPQGSAGLFIDKAGLKGTTSGGAIVSEKHANFIINKGGAKAADVLALIDIIKGKVKEKFGIDLELEVRIIGQ